MFQKIEEAKAKMLEEEVEIRLYEDAPSYAAYETFEDRDSRLLKFRKKQKNIIWKQSRRKLKKVHC